MLSPKADPQMSQPIGLESPSAIKNRPTVVGIYGVPGSGKTFLLSQLKQVFGLSNFAFYEGSEMIANVAPGGLEAFKKLEKQDKMHWRQLAINIIRKKAANSGHVAVVVGHFMFWGEEEDVGLTVCTQDDLETFTHILYLDTPAEVVAQRCLQDTERSRPLVSVTHIHKWQQTEKTQLRRLCRSHSILFITLPPHQMFLAKCALLLRDFSYQSEKNNLFQAECRLDEVVGTDEGRLETVLVMDADKTLAAEDTGSLFWKRVFDSHDMKDEDDPLKAIFSSSLGYSYTAFRQATLLYEETVDDGEFDAICQDVASTVAMHPEFVSLLNLVREQEHVGAVIITCGLRRIWEQVIQKEGLSGKVKVIGGGRIADGFVVTPVVKAALVTRLRNAYQLYVWAFGDSPLDLDMLIEADQAIVIVGEEQARSKTMDKLLMNAIDQKGLRACQAILPCTAPPRLDITKLPLIQLSDNQFVESVLRRRSRRTGIQVLHATEKNTTKLLMTPMRDANVAGPILREVHRRVGWYLATEFLADVIGIEEYPISHVQGHSTSGYRLLYEQKTSIIPLMRGGEAMAFGVNEAFPLAMFVHASRPEDVMLYHLQGQRTVVLVDSVVNTGKSIVQFVQHIRILDATIRIVIIAGVVQGQSISEGILSKALAGHSEVTLIALRLSENKFTGRGTTDTGNRLFNTTHLS